MIRYLATAYIKLQTIRFHIKHIKTKTGIHRHFQLLCDFHCFFFQGKALDNTLSMLGMSYDDKLGEDGKRTTGELVLDEDDDGVMITWPNAGAKKNFKLINQGYRYVKLS